MQVRARKTEVIVATFRPVQRRKKMTQQQAASYFSYRMSLNLENGSTRTYALILTTSHLAKFLHVLYESIITKTFTAYILPLYY